MARCARPYTSALVALDVAPARMNDLGRLLGSLRGELENRRGRFAQELGRGLDPFHHQELAPGWIGIAERARAVRLHPGTRRKPRLRLSRRHGLFGHDPEQAPLVDHVVDTSLIARALEVAEPELPVASALDPLDVREPAIDRLSVRLLAQHLVRDTRRPERGHG